MPFGLKSAGNTFVRAMSMVLQPIRAFTESFLDDMAVCSMSWDEHLLHVSRYLQTIQESGLTISLKKCTFGQSQVTFLGHLLRSGTKAVDPSKVACLDHIVAPTTKRDVRKLVGFFSYFRSFIPNLAESSQVLTDLTKRHDPNRVPSEPRHQAALDRDQLRNAVTLHSIDFSQGFGLLTSGREPVGGR